MQNKYTQASLFDDYESVAANLEENKSRQFRQFDMQIQWEQLSSPDFYCTFYNRTRRPVNMSRMPF